MAADSSNPVRFTISSDTVKAWCIRQKYSSAENPLTGQIAIHYKLLDEPAPLMVMFNAGRGMVTLAMKQPFSVPAARRAAIGDAAGLLNATLFMGTWVINRETGELFFRVTLPTLDIGYTDDGFLHAARIVVGTSERVAPALRAIALDGAEPSTIMAAIVAAPTATPPPT